MPRSVALTGLIIIMSLAIVGFGAFSTGTAPAAVDVADLDARAAAAVLAAPLVAGPAATAPAAPPEQATPAPAEPRPALRSRSAPAGQEQRAPGAGTTTTTTTTTTTVPAPTTTVPAATTTTTVPATTTTTTTTTTTVPTTTTIPATTTTAVPSTSVHPPAVEQWRALVATYFPAARVEEALRIIDCESNGDPDVTNPASGAAGLFQFLPSTWNSVAGQMGLPDYASGAPYDPASNVAAAAWLVQSSTDANASNGPWSHWSCRWVVG